MSLLLKQLDIHGFKSFASPTTFVFDRGITAIIGPNGSGKSNVAEALRWVLGEQGHSNLRSRRTEDVIFAGSDKRSQLSLAEVTLVLDNSDGSLPLAFSEVTVSRRAFRTGESQYLINGGRVRLRDVQQLVAPLGQAYTIIGQGLVDAALSQRPEERRGLFEHAAGISGLRLRANDAERSLNEASNNAQRLRDIVGELEPRVRALARSARLAQEYGVVRDRLRSAQRLQYAHQWSTLMTRIEEAQRVLQAAELACDAHHSSHVRITTRLGELRGRERGLATELVSTEEQIRRHEQDLVRARHHLDLLDARSHANADRISDLTTSLRDTKRERAETLTSAARYQQDLTEMKQQIDAIEHELQERDAVMAATASQREAMRLDLARRENAVIDLSRRIAGLEGNLQSLAERHASLRQESRQVEEAAELAESRRASLELSIASLADQTDALHAELAETSSRMTDIDQQIAVALESSRQMATEADHVERELAAHRGRLEALERTHLSGEGLFAGVRAVLRAVKRGNLVLTGFVGVLAETIIVPARLETAIEVALGGHLQDIVVRRWSDAQEAIAFLKSEGAGRATFQPLDTLRASRQRRLDLHDPDLLGIASGLIECSPDVRVVVEQLLGQTLIVTDLDASRRLVSQGNGWTLVTLAGEITRSSGSVTGGGRTAESGLLARERERRVLPTTIAETEKRLMDLRGRERVQVAEIERLRIEHRSLEAELSTGQRQFTLARTEIEQKSRDLHAQRDAMATFAQRRREILDRQAEMKRAESSARDALDTLTAERDEHSSEAEGLRASLQAFTIESDLRATALRADLAGARERTRAIETLARQASLRASQLDHAISTRSTEIERLTAAEGEIETERGDAARDIARLEQLIETQRATLLPRRSEMSALTSSIASAELELDASIGDLRERERDRDRATLHVARAQDEQVFLIERIRNDLEIEDPATLMHEIASLDNIPDEQEIGRLRERMRRMAVVGTDVIEQHEAESERLDFMMRQLADVDEATIGLRKVLDELSTQMAARFSSTFRDVAAAFELTFARLFGGGSARLVYSDSDDGSTGIDIIAQPPGKRLQNLNVLSGGERALTAVALLIAIQRVNPSPFCLLDEVDAALDESNVLRFRDEIRDLSETTQFVLITHNRGTIEGADTLYGVTMGDDGISRVLSLRLAEAIETVESFGVSGAAR
jgi:chromosome segregation protein